MSTAALPKLGSGEHDIEHDLHVMVETKSALDDHWTEGGYCPTCQLWIVRTTFANGRVEDSLMPVEQRNELQRDTRSGLPYSVLLYEEGEE